MKVLCATGGSGGHIFPAIEMAKELRQRGHEIIFAGALQPAQEKIIANGFNFRLINPVGLKDKSIGGLWLFSCAMMGALRASAQVISQEKPDAVVGFGGYGSFPLVMMASIKNVRTMIHEQNVVPGKANRILKFFVKKLAISFKQTGRYMRHGHLVWTGCPCHSHEPQRNRSQILASWGLDTAHTTLVLLGGSQGSVYLNDIFYRALKRVAPSGKYQAIHVCGRQDIEKYAPLYKDFPMKVFVAPFISPVEEVYAVADFLLSRAGASSVTEIALHGVNSMLVPFPFAGNHQRYNADVIARASLALLVEQKDLSVDRLVEAIEQTGLIAIDTRKRQLQGREIVKANAAVLLADEVESL